MQRVLITGAAGTIGNAMREQLQGAYPVLRLSDIREMPPAGSGEEVMQGDITDPADCARICQDVDGILHFGGQPGEHDWETIRARNIDGAYNMFEAARTAGVKRFVFASSNHAVGYYRRDQRIAHDVIVRPDTRYGLSKAFGEALGALYADKHGLGVFAIRIGNLTDRPADKRRLSIWSSPRDLAQLCRIGLDHPDIRFEIVYGVSDNDRGFYDNSNAYRLGYKPQDRSEDYTIEVLAAEPAIDPNDVSEIYQGGTFVKAQ